MLIKPKDYLYTSDDEDFAEGSGDIPDTQENPFIKENPDIKETEDQDTESVESSVSGHLSEEESKIR